MAELKYKDAGVDKEAGYEAVQRMKAHVKKTFNEHVLTDLGSFGGLFNISKFVEGEPVLVAGTDGVGTKLKLAFERDLHTSIGEDCVAMCVNDVLCQGATPLFFLDYIATDRVIPEKIEQIVSGIACGCQKGQMALIGGETAEMPGMYGQGEYDLAGFAVGIADKKKIIDGSQVEIGDIVMGLPSSGVHSNGFSLVRKILEQNQINLKTDPIVADLLVPTRIYAKPLVELNQHFTLTGIAHITGGGFYENIPRILKDNQKARIHKDSFPKPSVFQWIQEKGPVSEEEMYATFNMGIGIVFTIRENQLEAIENYLKERDEPYYVVGKIEAGNKEVDLWA